MRQLHAAHSVINIRAMHQQHTFALSQQLFKQRYRKRYQRRLDTGCARPSPSSFGSNTGKSLVGSGYLLFTLGWSALTVLDAPHVISRPSSLFYEASLLLNGVILALCFYSPLSSKFS